MIPAWGINIQKVKFDLEGTFPPAMPACDTSQTATQVSLVCRLGRSDKILSPELSLPVALEMTLSIPKLPFPWGGVITPSFSHRSPQ